MKRLSEREWDRRLGVLTTGREDESGGRYMPYEPTPYPVLEALGESGWLSADNHLADYGCGKGRVAFFLADRVGCRVTGIDRSEKLITMAEANRARFAAPERVRFLAVNAEAYAPGDEDAFFFFNPFSEKVLDVALRRILARERPARLFFYYPMDAFLARLAVEPRLRTAGEIDCRSLFDGDNPRERVLVLDAV